MPKELILLVEHISQLPITSKQIRTWAHRDLVLSQVEQFTYHGWPESCPNEELKLFRQKRHEVSIHDGCLLWGSRVVVPNQGRRQVLLELHQGHQGCTRMKSLARMYIWWPGLDADIENAVKGCERCQENQLDTAVTAIEPWKWPAHPWSRLHLDFAGPFLGKQFLVIVDAHTKWLEVHIVPSLAAIPVIQRLRSVFAQFGIPQTIVTDNGATFCSAEFQQFLESNGIEHLKSAPYHPSSNGLAERAVQTFKQGLRKLTEESLFDRMSRFLFVCRNTPHGTTGASPAQLMFGRPMRSRLDLLRPNIAARWLRNKSTKSRIMKMRRPQFSLSLVRRCT